MNQFRTLYNFIRIKELKHTYKLGIYLQRLAFIKTQNFQQVPFRNKEKCYLHSLTPTKQMSQIKLQKSKHLGLLNKIISAYSPQYTSINPFLIQKHRNRNTGLFDDKLCSSQSQPLLNSSNKQFKHNFPRGNNNNYLNKDIQKLSLMLNEKNKTEQKYELIDELLSRMHLQFFVNIRKYLCKEQYDQLIDKCWVFNVPENKIISKKGQENQLFFVLLQGQVSYNQERVVPNTFAGQQQIQYSFIFKAQKGHLVNPETLHAPKHNIYTVLSHTLTVLLAFPSNQTYTKFLKKPFSKQLQQKANSLSNTSLFKGISSLNMRKLMPYFFTKCFYKFNEVIYKQQEESNYIYWILDGQVQLIKEEVAQQDRQKSSGRDSSNNVWNTSAMNSYTNTSKQVCKIVKLSKYQIFGIDQYVFKNGCKYLFTARVCSQSLKTICIPYKSLIYIQNSYPCINQNIDFYLERASAMHSKIVSKNYKIMQNKENMKTLQKKKKNKRNKKKKKNPTSMEWWGLAQNTVGNIKYKLQLPKFQTIQPNSPKGQPKFDTTNYGSSKIEQFKRKLFEQQVDQMIGKQEVNKSLELNQSSPYKVDYVPKFSSLKIKMLDVRPRAIDNAGRVKRKLITYAKNMESFCDKLDLD